MNTKIRVATIDDAQFVHDVYGYYVEHTNVTFTMVNPSVEDYRVKIIKTLEKYPFYILEVDDVPCGFTYAVQIRPHDAYQWTAEGTICLSPYAPKRQGLGSILYRKLLDSLKAQGMQAIFGVITSTNEPSIQMHLRMGFENVGQFPRMGNKNGEWHDIIWMHKTLNTLPDRPQPPVPFSELVQLQPLA